MRIHTAFAKLYLVCDWIMKLAYVNLLWFLFTIIGLVIFGFMPASVALFTVVRKWLMKDTDIPIFQTFFQTYKKEFLQANKLGITFLVVGIVLYINSLFIKAVSASIQNVFLVPFLIACLFYLVTLLYILPVYVHYELTFFHYIKNAFFIGVLNPLKTIVMLLCISLLVLLFFYVPEIVPFFSIVLFAFVAMWGAKLSFQKIEMKRSNLSDNT